MSTKLSGAENFAVGATAGTIEVTILQPMLYCKNATQQGLPLTLNPMVLYRGLTVSVINMASLTALQFPLSSFSAGLITGGASATRSLTDAEQIGAGFCGGALSGFLCAPMELVLIQQQRFGGSLLGTPARIIGTSGALGIFRGLIPSCGREGLFTAGYVGVGPAFGAALRENFGLDAVKSKMLGAIGAGVLCATLSHPLDTMKTCMQGDIEQKTYKGFTHTYSTLVSQGGMSSFFRGWSWRTGRMILAVGIMTECKERLGPLMFPAKYL
jgi:hypothetical protein